MTKEIENSPKIGRPKGSLNARTQDLFDLSEELGINPFKVLLFFANRDHVSLGLPEYTYKVFGKGEDANTQEELTISPETQMSAASKACEYLYPKRKAVEVSGDNVLEQAVIQLAYRLKDEKN